MCASQTPYLRDRALRPCLDLTIEDAPQLARLHQAAFEESWSEASIRELFSLRDAIIAFGCRDGESVLAFALLLPCVDDIELATITTRQDLRGQGLADQLLAHAMDEAKASGYARMLLEVADDNPGAVRLYEKHGFGLDGIRKGYYPRQNAKHVDARLMSAPLRA